MSEQGLGEGSPPTGTAVKALAAGAATAAATYAFKRALSSRSDNAGHGDEDEEGSRESIRNEREALGGDEGTDTEEMSAESERDDDQVGERDEADDHTEDAPEPGAGRSPDGPRGLGSAKSKLQQVSSSALVGAAPVLLPVAESAADSAGRYVADHAPEIIKDHVVVPLIDAFEKAR